MVWCENVNISIIDLLSYNTEPHDGQSNEYKQAQVLDSLILSFSRLEL